MIAVLKRSGFDDRKRTQGVDCAGCLHALVFSGACDIFSGETSITCERKICQTFIAVHIDRLNLGPVPTTQLNWLQPHEGNLIDFLFRARAFQTAEL